MGKETVTLKGPLLQQKSLKLKVKLLILSNKKIIKITPFPFTKVSSNKTRLMKTIQGTTCALIKQSLVEVVTTLYKKLKLVGVGYRLIPVESFEKRLILLRLGFMSQSWKVRTYRYPSRPSWSPSNRSYF